LSLQGEKASADASAAEEFKRNLFNLISSYSLDQIFNCDETGLYYRLLSQKALAGSFEKRADGRKKLKDHVTVNVCANITGSIKLPLLLIGKAAHPRCFRGINMASLPVTYMNQQNAWVDTTIFSLWFQNHFVPFVQKKLQVMKLPKKALLILDNCSAHPDEELATCIKRQIS